MPRISNLEVLFLPQRPIIRITGKLGVQDFPAAIGAGFAALGRHVAAVGGKVAEVPFVAFRPEGEGLFTLSVIFPLAEAVPGEGDIVAETLPAGEHLFCMYLGAYDGTEGVYQEMYDWLEAHGAEKAEISYETYYNGQDYPVEQLLTRIMMPIIYPPR